MSGPQASYDVSPPQRGVQAVSGQISPEWGVDKLLNRRGPTIQNIPHCVLMRTSLCCMKLKTSCNCVWAVLLSVFGC